MKNIILFICVILFLLPLVGCGSTTTEPNGSDNNRDENIQQDEEQVVVDVVTEFGSRLQKVSLMAPDEDLKISMQENYGELVSPALLEKWQSNPQEAPGRLVSSPWPDRIEVKSIEKVSEEEFEVKGDIIEMTSVEAAKGGVAEKRPITLVVKKIDSLWKIDDVVLGDFENSEDIGTSDVENSYPENSDAIVYRNGDYGFTFLLPKSWADYTIVTENWEGLALGRDDGEVVESWPTILIRHPMWTEESPRQDIPIMVLTIEQWEKVEKEEIHIGAAPIPPRVLGESSEYVFALPARYNYAFPTGYEEVEEILNNQSLEVIDSSK